MNTARRPAPIGVSELPSLSAVVLAFAAIVAVFLPWYVPNLAGPLELDPVSGWSATSLGKGTLVVAVIWLIAAGLALMEQTSPGRLDRATLNLMGWLVTGCAFLCTLMTAYRFLRPPPPADFLTRDYGLFIALAASIAGIAAGLAMAHGRRPRTRASARRRALRGS